MPKVLNSLLDNKVIYFEGTTLLSAYNIDINILVFIFLLFISFYLNVFTDFDHYNLADNLSSV